MPELLGLLFIGDPHLSSRVPGFRKDDYPKAILGKLKWSLQYARDNVLLPVLLGDLFDYPRDNANWLVYELLGLFETPILAVSGNHDCKENVLTEHDTLSILVAAGRVRLLEAAAPWVGRIGSAEVVIAGTPWGQKLPKSLDKFTGVTESDYVFWIAHHDIRFPGYEEVGRFGCYEISGVDAVINGHIHRALPSVVVGQTTWLNPGNIARVARSDASREHVPSVLRIDIKSDGWLPQRIQIPHQPFDEVFHSAVQSQEVRVDDSLFIRGLADLVSTRTASGAGLDAFLDANLPQFDSRVAGEIRLLAKEVLTHAD
jgi:predicted phosphodiesterase